MTTRILPSAISLLLCLSVARAEDVIASGDSSIPFETIVPGVGTGYPDEVVPEVAPGEPDVVPVENDVAVPVPDGVPVEADVSSPDPDGITVKHYSGSEVERGGGEVDPVLMYSSGGITTLGGSDAGGAGLDPVAAGSGLEAAAALKLDVTELVRPARELKVLDTAGDIVISD